MASETYSPYDPQPNCCHHVAVSKANIPPEEQKRIINYLCTQLALVGSSFRVHCAIETKWIFVFPGDNSGLKNARDFHSQQLGIRYGTIVLQTELREGWGFVESHHLL